ncbi:hypothetical protein ACFB49_39250 [Sphingomonas sp. DBB INV C78]|uniref:NAD(P)/FAD-dependent oxidoreductase n=1 Tax=Sphingomonas sp. DBB INV C78 TaxID=3349434 RepID=UPI0036D3C51E
MRRTDTLIVGGGPAGSAVAITLAEAGHHPLLIERHETPQQIVCGGFLAGDALAALARLGVDANALGARPIHRLRFIAGARIAEAALPFPAAGLSRPTLDTALRARSAAAGAIVETGHAVRAINGDTVRLDNGEDISAPAIFLATGKHDLRGAARPREAMGADPAVGLRTRLALTPALAAELDGVIELHLFDRGYAGLLLQEDGTANLCLSVARSRLAAAADPTALLTEIAKESPTLTAHLDQAGSIESWQAISNIPYGWRLSSLNQSLYRVGDQAAVIASLAGDGIAIALTSGHAAAAAFLAGHDPSHHARAFGRRAQRPLAVAGAIRHLAEHRHRDLLVRAAGVPGLIALAARLTRIDRH